jgi:hypothetical protein
VSSPGRDASASVDYLDALSSELASAGIRGHLRARILTEFADHLSADPAAQLGAPGELAGQFADELGTTRARRAGWWSFGALSVAGLVMAGAFASSWVSGIDWGPATRSTTAFGALSALVMVVAAQVAFVTGVLAALRIIRLRRSAVMAREQTTIIVRRASTGLVAGVVSMAGLAGAAGAAHHVPTWWSTSVVAGSALGCAMLLASAPAALSATRVRPAASGSRGDLFEDLGPLAPAALNGRPWMIAVIVAGAVAVAITLAGAFASDGYDGALRGLADGLACLAGFLVLGRYLGLRD